MTAACLAHLNKIQQGNSLTHLQLQTNHETSRTDFFSMLSLHFGCHEYPTILHHMLLPAERSKIIKIVEGTQSLQQHPYTDRFHYTHRIVVHFSLLLRQCFHRLAPSSQAHQQAAHTVASALKSLGRPHPGQGRQG